jgi:signal transduction histidine kinase
MNLFFGHLRHSFNARIFCSMIILLITTTMALNYYFYVRSSDELKNEMIHHNQSLAKILANTSRLGIFTGDEKALRANAALMAQEQDCQSILFLDANGAELLKYDLHPGAQTVADPLQGPEIMNQIKAHGSFPSFVLPTDQELVMVEPVMADQTLSGEELFFADSGKEKLAPRQKAIGYVALMVDTANHQRTIQNQFIRDTAITIAITLLGCLIISAIIHFLTIPLRQLTHEIISNDPALRDISDDRTFSPPSDFNQMIATIRAAFQSITDLKETLEEKVKERTRQLAASNQELTTQKNGLSSANQRLATTLSQLQETQTQLVQSEKMAALGLLIAGLSHEIKNSINFISGSVPLLKKTLLTSLAGKEGSDSGVGTESNKALALLANIQEGVDRTVRVIDDLGHFCHDSEAGFAPTDILPGLKASIAILRHEFGQRIEIIEELAPGMPLVRARSGQLNQVFINILINAAQAIAEQGTIRVRSWADEAAVHIAITDSGQGIKDQNLGRIYDPFYTTKEVGHGTGLGLSISYNIVKKHDGDLKVDSTPGAGTTFEIILPAIPHPSEAQATLSS